MQIPKGNLLIEDELLPFSDVNIMLANLEKDQFTGYVKIDFKESCGYVFFVQGNMMRAIEVENGSEAVSLHLVNHMLSRIKTKDYTVSTYVASAQMVNVLSGIFAFQPLYIEYEVKRRELKKVLDNLEQGKYSGLIKLSSMEGTCFLLVDNGELVADRFCREYGQVLCGAEAVKELLEYSYKNGATISVFAEKSDDIAARGRKREAELANIRQLIVKQEGGFMRAKDVVQVEDYLLREWNIDTKSTCNVEIETPDGEFYEYKCKAGRGKMGGYAGLTSDMIKQMNLSEGDQISIRPID